MRVALLLSEFPVLSETFILGELTGLLDRGVDVRVIAQDRAGAAVLHHEVTRYRLLERTTYAAALGPIRPRVRRLKAALLLHALARGGFTPAAVAQLVRHGRADADLAVRFADLMREPARYDVVHAHFGPNGELALALRNLGLLRGAVITTFHGYDVSRNLRQAAGRYARLFREGDLFLPVSRYWRDALIEAGCPPERTVVHHMGVDCTRLQFRPRQPASARALRVLSVGRLVEKKGFEYGLRAVAALEQQHPGIEYTIMGDGPLRARLAALGRELGLGERVRMPGSLPAAAVRDAMASADVLLHPSVTAQDGDQEGIPVVLMEAMASGLPVVSTWHTGIPELVEHDVSGQLAPERDVAALAAALARVATEPARVAAEACAARRKVESEFNTDVLNDQLLDHFRRAAHR